MKRLPQSLEQLGAGRATYELSDGRKIELDLDEARTATEAEIRAAHGLDEPTDRIPLKYLGEVVGSVPADFHPMGFDSASSLYDVRPGDFVEEDGAWVAHRSLGPRDLRAVPGFKATEPRIDYLSEREAQALRCAYPDLFDYDLSQMDVLVRDVSRDARGERLRIPGDLAARFITDWQRSGAWRLLGRDAPFQPKEPSVEDCAYKPDLIIYHDHCADGIVAAWACHRQWGDKPQYVAANYNCPPPVDVRGRDILVVDFSYSADVLRGVIEAGAASIVILDHHKTARDALADFMVDEAWPGEITRANISRVFARRADAGEPPIVAIFDMDRSGARMAWDFAHGVIGDSSVPWLVELAEQYDLWTFAQDAADDAELLHLEIQRGGFTIAAVDRMNRELERGRAPLERGEVIYDWRKQLIEEISARAYQTNFNGWLGVVTVECPYSLVSSVAHHLLGLYPHAPFVACAVSQERYVSYSLRSEDSRTDVGEVARILGGGGHRNASGVRVERGYNPPGAERLLLAAAKQFMPGGIAIGTGNLPDEATIALDVPIGELRALEAAIANAEGR